MNETEEKEVLEYVKREKAFWNELADDIKGAFIVAIIVVPLMALGGWLLSIYNPDFLERLQNILQWI